LIAEEGAGFLMLDIAKNRNGATGMVPMRLDWWTGGGRFKGIGA
jgi:replicative DNA helicase